MSFFQGNENNDTATEYEPILSFGVLNRKDTTLSSASSGVSSGSPLSHSPAASQSSNSSLSPRQQSPVGWQHGSENDFSNVNLKFLEDSSTLPPPPGINNTAPIWSPHCGNEVRLFAKTQLCKTTCIQFNYEHCFLSPIILTRIIYTKCVLLVPASCKCIS